MRLRDATSETANLIILDGDHAIYIDQVESSYALRHSGWVGRRVPLAGTALAALVAAASGTLTLALLVWLGAAAAIVIHVGYAAWRAHQGAGLLTAVRLLPGYVMDKCRIALAALSATDTAWVRTARRGELP